VDPNNSAMSADDADRTDRRTAEPEGLSQQDQLNALRAEGPEGHEDRWFDMTEQEEARIFENEFDYDEETGVYRERKGERGETP
jgi:hypothetical protein